MNDSSRSHSDLTDDRDFRQFTGAFDRSIAPAPSFAESLKRQVIQSTAPATAEHQPAGPPVTTAGPPVVTFMDRRPWRVGLSILEIAAALLLISALALSAYIINSVGRPAEPDAEGIRRSSQGVGSPTTPDSATTGEDAVNWGGDAGRTQYYGDAEVHTGESPLFIRVGGVYGSRVGPGLIVGESWYGWAASTRANTFMRVDLIAQVPVWTKDYLTWGTPASDGEHIFTFLLDESDTPTPVLVAIDMHNGEIAWRGPALHPFTTFITVESDGAERIHLDSITESNGPVVIHDMVVFADGAGTTVALNAKDGTERWRYDRSADFAGYSNEVGSPTGGTIVANDGYVFVTLPDASIVRLDPKSGEELDHLVMVDPYFQDRHMTGLALRGDSLIATTASSFVDLGSPPGDNFSALLVMDAETFDVTASTDITELSFSRRFVVTDTSAFVYARSESGEMQFYEIDLATGRISEGFGELSEGFAKGSLVGGAQLSGSGSTLIATESNGIVLYFSMETHELIDSYRFDPPGLTTQVGGPLPIVDGTPVFIWKEGTNDPVPQETPVS